MNQHTVNISSLVILLALLSFILEVCLYYFVPMHLVTLLTAAVVSIILTHFFLEASLDYDYCFLYGALMTVGSLAFCAVVALMQPNEWISYDYSLILLIFINWFVPFVYCFLRDFFDKGPRFSDYLFFFHGMSVVFLLIYLVAILLSFFFLPLNPPYETLAFGAHNFVPFMAAGMYIEAAVSVGADFSDMLLYMVEMAVLAIPFGFYARTYFRKIPFLLRILLYLFVPILLEMLQFLTGIGRPSIDAYTLFLIGAVIGIILYHIIYAISYGTNKRDFLEDRTVAKKLLFHF